MSEPRQSLKLARQMARGRARFPLKRLSQLPKDQILQEGPLKTSLAVQDQDVVVINLWSSIVLRNTKEGRWFDPDVLLSKDVENWLASPHRLFAFDTANTFLP